MELLQLKYFCHAAECENFSKTAERYRVPTSNISSSVRRLENELGVKLFNRTANRLRLNENGKKFLLHIKKGLAEIESGKIALNSDTEAPRGELNLLLSSCRRIATRAVEIFQKKYPNVRFNVRYGTSTEEFDVIISDIPPEKGEYDKIKLLTERILLAIPKASPLYNESAPEQKLEQERFISLGDGTRLHELTLHICRSLGFEPDIAIKTDDPYYMRKYLENGLGIAFIPERSWDQLLPPEVRLVDIGAAHRTIFLFTPKNREKTQAQKLFADIITQCFAEENI